MDVAEASPNAAFNHKVVPLFSDLLLHDVGPATASGRKPQSRRSSGHPRCGLRLRRPLLHDGAGATIEDAIAQHGGEASAVRQRFAALPPDQRAALLAFLKSL